MAEVEPSGTRPAEAGPVEGDPAPARSRGPLLKLGILVALLFVAFFVARSTPLGRYLAAEGVFELVAWLRGHPWAPVVFIGLYATATALAIPGTILTLAGGAVFGFAWGTVFNLAGANLGANAAFLIARALGRDGVVALADRRTKRPRSKPKRPGRNSAALEKLEQVTMKHGFQGLLTLRLIPLVPFNVLNFGSGLLPIRWRSYALATLIGIVPGAAVYTFFADALLQGSQEARADALIRVAIAGALLLLLSFLPTLLRHLGVRLPGAEAGNRAGLPAVALLLGLAGTVAGTGSARGQDGFPDHASFSRVLAAVVHDEGVDYARLAADSDALYRYIEALAATDPAAVSRASNDDRLAFWINAYNACMLKRVIESYPIEPAGGLHGVRNRVAGRPANSVWQISDVFTGDHCPVAGSERSQDEIEHEIIRPMGDPRIHFAVNCAAVSCPPLIPRAYLGATLQTQLDERVKAFVGNDFHFNVPVEEGGRRVVHINQVLNWFKEDFGDIDGIRRFLAGYATGDARAALEDPASEISFMEYDWTLNDAPIR